MVAGIAAFAQGIINVLLIVFVKEVLLGGALLFGWMAKKLMLRSWLYILVFLNLWALDFLINFVNTGRKTMVPAISLDDRIPLVPVFVYFYAFYFPLVLVPLFAFMRAPHALQHYVVASGFVMVVSYVIYLVWPTEVLRSPVAPTSLSRQLLLLFRHTVGPYNVLPSLHASMLMVAFLSLYAYTRPLAWYLALPIGLSILSIVFTKQHYILDLVTAIPLALAAFFLTGLLVG